MTERVNHPQHYGGMGLPFCLGNALKYICRAPHKGAEREDLEKARWYLQRACDEARRTKRRWPGDRGTVGADELAAAWGLPQPLAEVVARIDAAIMGHDVSELERAEWRLDSYLRSGL